MKQTLNLQSNYSAIENGYQLWIPLDCSISIPEDDPVRLLNAVAERMDYNSNYHTLIITASFGLRSYVIRYSNPSHISCTAVIGGILLLSSPVPGVESYVLKIL